MNFLIIIGICFTSILITLLILTIYVEKRMEKYERKFPINSKSNRTIRRGNKKHIDYGHQDYHKIIVNNKSQGRTSLNK